MRLVVKAEIHIHIREFLCGQNKQNDVFLAMQNLLNKKDDKPCVAWDHCMVGLS